jgi:protein SCO1/2
MKLSARKFQAKYHTSILSMAGLSLALWLGACGGSQPAEEPAQPQLEQVPPAASGPQRHELTGTVVSVDRAGKSLVVDHAEIPGFMQAMAMPYAVQDEQELEGLAAGNRVTAEVVVDPSGSMWLENIEPAPEAGQ